MYEKPARIDDSTRPQHRHLAVSDSCIYLGEYSAREGFQASEMNQLIFNLKKPVSKKGSPGYHYKAEAIEKAARWIATRFSAKSLSSATFIPIPPSKITGDPEYDDRVAEILMSIPRFGKNVAIDVRKDAVTQVTSTEAAHQYPGARLTPEEYAQNYRVNPLIATDTKDKIVIFDDVLTTGAHFKAMKLVLEQSLPGKKFIGLFVARTVHKV